MRRYKFSPGSEKSKAIIVVMLVVVSLAALFSYEGILLHNRTIDQVILEKEKSIYRTVRDITLYSFAPYEQRLVTLLSTHEGISRAFSDHDRETLYRLTLPLYEELKRENNHLHVMHFHLPDGHSFLRMHKPDKFGDDLRKIRPAVQYVHQKRTPLTCYEIGVLGVFYRIIQPVFYQGSYVGVVELGFKVHSVLESLKKQISDPLATYFVADRWQKMAKSLEYESLPFGKYIINSHNDPFFKQLPPDLDILAENVRLTIAGNAYLLHAYPVFTDFQGKPIGGFVVMQDLSQALIAKKTFIIQSVAFSCLLLAISLVVLYLSFGKIIDKLELSRASLKKTVVKLGMEVDERKQTEMQLSKSKKEWERTFDGIGDIVTIMNGQLQILKANQAAYRLLNAEPGTLIGKFCYQVFNNRLSACIACPGIDTINNCMVSSSEIEHQYLGKSFLITTSPVPDEHGEFTHIVHIAKDITEKKELETKLRQAQKMEAIGALAGGIAHDFNNILTAIYGYSQLAMRKAGADRKLVYDLNQIHSATERAKDLVSQILTFSRQTEYAKRPLQISLIVKEALKLLRSSIPTTIELKQNIDAQANILADPTQIHQVVMNLATNAYHAMMESGGILGVSLKEIIINGNDMITEIKMRPGKYICLEVSDTGCGMDKETKEKIFEPYFTTKEVGKGTGLGLAVVHGIVTDCNGYITVYSEPGKGTAFLLYFPIVEGEAVDCSNQGVAEPVRGGNERIMFVDDEAIIANLASEVLKIYGYKITMFTNAVLAMQDFATHPDEYDLVITDMSMPIMTGLQLSRKIKEIRPDLSIILCSGYSEIIYKEKALALGISRYVPKPLMMDHLAKVVREVLDLDKPSIDQ
ncbi:MAG: response regulator [Proteobacteria bacterium]|nr:response regulator [Pseudomonadota bacterium]MBU1057745.1 response regulator [Pseudomonadota bacterium]